MDGHSKYKIGNIPIVYEDNWLLIVDKPSGLLTIPTPKKESRTLTSILNLHAEVSACRRDTSKSNYIRHPCHRLDRETSGLIIYAKGKSIQKKMMDEFKNKRVRKTYLAFVQGIPAQNLGEIRSSIEGLSAVTKYKVIQKRNGFTVVEAMPLTGRTNQIRIHFKSIGHPILGERKFAFRRDFKIKAKRLCLHASSLEFIHPVTKELVSLDIGLPQDLEEFLKGHK